MSEASIAQLVAAALKVEFAGIRRDLADIAKVKGTRLTRAEVCERLEIHRNTLKTYIDTRDFPRAGRDGKWLLSDVIEWEAR